MLSLVIIHYKLGDMKQVRTTDLPIPKYPVESLESNITFGDLQSMSFEEVSSWVDDMRLELKNIWDNGIPPYHGYSNGQFCI